MDYPAPMQPEPTQAVYFLPTCPKVAPWRTLTPMALLKLDPPGTTWPRLHDRSYSPSTIQSRPLLRRFPRVHKPRSSIRPTTDLFGQNFWPVQVNRQYTTLIAKWWKDGAQPVGQAYFAALAAAVQIYNNKHVLITATPKQWFLWYQRRALGGWLSAWCQFNPTPNYYTESWPYEWFDFPNYPRLPWSPPAAPQVLSVVATSDAALHITVHLPQREQSYHFNTWLNHGWRTLPANAWPHMIQGRTGWAMTPSGDWDYDFEALAPNLVPPPRPGSRGLAATAFFDSITQQPGAITAVPFSVT